MPYPHPRISLNGNSKKPGSSFESMNPELCQTSMGQAHRDIPSEVDSFDKIILISGEKPDEGSKVATELAITKQDAKPCRLH
jgi:hypothetical protein